MKGVCVCALGNDGLFSRSSFEISRKKLFLRTATRRINPLAAFAKKRMTNQKFLN